MAAARPAEGLPERRRILSGPSTTVGIVANPASGRDVRRLVSQASIFPAAEKGHMVQRMLGAMGSLGVGRVLLMPDRAGICAAVRSASERPAPAHRRWPRVEILDTPAEERVGDTVAAVRRMVAEGVSAIAVLGGDGTCRAVAAHCGTVPLATLSTGTNNVFPDLREATVTGLATGLVAMGLVPAGIALRRHKVLRIASSAPGRREEIALVDACVSTLPSVGARALWQAESLVELAVAFAEPDAIGLSSIAGLLHPVGRGEPRGLYLRLADARSPAARTTVAAPIAPGLVVEVGVAAVEVLAPLAPRRLERTAGTVALDGEREVELGPEEQLTVTLDLAGPLTVDVPAALSWAAAHGVLRTGAGLGSPG